MEWLIRNNLALAVLVFLVSFNISYSQAASPVLLTLDVERKEDVNYLKELNITEPSTYFFLGKIIEENSEYITDLAKSNTIGSHAYSHSNLTKLSSQELYLELKLTKELLEKITGKPVKWFRAPYLEYNDTILK